MKILGPRERAGDYLAELQARFGDRPQLLEVNRGWRLNPAACMGGYSDEPRKPYNIESGIAIIDISGVLSNDPWWYDETGYADIQNEVTLAADDAEVDGILLRVNSPGGETDNAFETAALLSEVGKKKPMWAVADPIAYSAGYLLASQASKICVPQTSGGVGSVGVYMMHVDYSGALTKQGIKVTIISAGEGKTDGNPYQPLSDEAKASYSTEIDRLYGEFTKAVSRGRGISEEKVRALGAWTYPGSSRSIGIGLADAAGSLTDAHREFVASLQKSTSFSMRASAGMQSQKEVSKMETQEKKPADAPVAAAVVEQAAPAAAVPATVAAVAVDVEALIADAKKQGATEAVAQMEEVRFLCTLAGTPTRAADFIGKPLADVRKALIDARAEQDEKIVTSSQVASLPGGAASKIDSEAQEIAKRDGITKEQAFAKVLESNPKMYEQYLEEQELQKKAARA